MMRCVSNPSPENVGASRRPRPVPAAPATPRGALADTPLGADGAPLRARPAWWAEAEAQGPEALARAVVRRVAEGTPWWGRRHEVDGVTLVETLFAWQEDRVGPGRAAPADALDVVLHLNTLTDNHRAHLSPARMTRLGDSGWWASCLLLPADVIVGYRIVASAEALPEDLGTTRTGWKRLHDAGRPDPLNPHRIHDGFSHLSSVVHGPDACLHPEWSGEPVPGPRAVETDLSAQVLGPDRGRRRVTLHVPAAGERPAAGAPGGGGRQLLVLLDGEHWRGNDVLSRLAGRLRHWDLLIVDAGPLPVRAAQLGDAGRATDLLARCLEAAGAAGTGEVVVCGQSLGALAAATAALRRPDLCSGAVVQSGSFWQGSGVRGQGEGELLTWLREGGARHLGEPGARPRIVIQAGSHERTNRETSRTVASLLEQAGVDVTYREVRGGHDYAWWRHGLSWALDLWEQAPSAASV